MSNSEAAFASTATIAAELAIVSSLANDMSISVKNAKAIANRAGAKARGFSPITDFIDEMSIDTIKLVNLINRESVELSNIAINELRIRDAHEKFKYAMFNAANAEFIQSFSGAINNVKQKHAEEKEKLFKQARQLKDSMDDISKKMAVANVIVSNSRIEAVNAEEYRSNLETIAEDIDKSCETIRLRVSSASRRLDNAIYEWKRLTTDESD